MGHLFSRALRRFTQCSSNNNQTQRQQENVKPEQPAQQQREQERKPTVQQIPVGSSIDIADYAAFEASKQATKPAHTQSMEQALDNDVENNASLDHSTGKSNENTPEVEEAVIKIQALVRGHLTRKALKDAQQQNVTASPNAIGQSQFDEESLMRNPLSAVFSLNSPLNLNPNSNTTNENQASGKVTPLLESIAEESTNSISLDKSGETTEESGIRDSNKRLAFNQSLTLSVDRSGEPRGASPVPSETNASIDLNCDTPASVSIDISDHSILPTDKLASVLHYKLSPSPVEDTNNAQTESNLAPQIMEPPQVAVTRNGTPPPTPVSPNALVNSSSHSIDSAEAAAIRIQSAFRGYHTRKHSPYRRRSPNSLPQMYSNNSIHNGSNTNGNASVPKRLGLRQQDATDEMEELDRTARSNSNEEALDNIVTYDQMDSRQSRHRQRDAPGAPAFISSTSIDDSLATDESTIKEAHPTQSDEVKRTGEAALIEDLDEEIDLSSTNIDNANQNTEQELSTFDVTGLTSVLENLNESMEQENSGGNLVDGIQQASQVSQLPRSSFGANSIELDTDSSNLGAALSMNEEVFENTDEQTQEQIRKVSNQIEEDQANFLASLVDEPSNSDTPIQVCKIEELETAHEDASGASEAALDEIINNSAAISEQEQHAIELESDDIERRDPRGHSSDERAKSPQIKSNTEQLLLAGASSSAPEFSAADGEPTSRLAVESPDEAFASGPPSPALASSIGATSSDESAESDPERPQQEEEEQQQQQQQQHQKQGPSGTGCNRNKKRNRNKKKGKK